MADLSDEEKARLIADTDVKDADDAEKEPDEPVGEAGKPAETPEEEKPEPGIEEGEPEPSTFTKKFPNLKGDTPEEYVPNLEQAYQNSFTEALRIKKELDEANRKLAQAGPPVPPEQKPEPPTPDPLSQSPDLQYIKAIRDRDMKMAFDKFADSYPQVRDADNFAKFRDSADPLGQAFFTTEGRQSTYDELFPRIAAYLGWQTEEADARKGQGLKESLSTVRNNSATIPKGKQPRVTDAQVDAYLKMYPGKNRNDVVKELSEVI